MTTTTTTLTADIRPYCYRREELAVGRLIDGKFVQERGIWNVTKDSRLKVKRAYEGKGAAETHSYTVVIPENYPLVVAKKQLTDICTTKAKFEFEILYTPQTEKDLVLTFGKHQGQKLADVPASYLAWLTSHVNSLREENRKFAKAAKKLAGN